MVARIGEHRLEAALAAGHVQCPDCAGSLRPWGFAREREVRVRHGGRLVRPRRGYCRQCERSHVLLPAFCVPRRHDSAQVIGSALLASAMRDSEHGGDGVARFGAGLSTHGRADAAAPASPGSLCSRARAARRGVRSEHPAAGVLVTLVEMQGLRVY